MIRQVIVMNKPLPQLPQPRLQRKAKDGSTFGTTTKINDSAGNKVSIPGGFKVSADSANNVTDGVVIEDNLGNQFVWIPVRNESEIVINTRLPTW